MSTLANVPENVGIRGGMYSNPGKYFISNEIKTTFLRCYSVLTNIQADPLPEQEKNDLICQVSNVYKKTENYLSRAIENKTTYAPFEFETFFETCSYKDIFETSTKPETKTFYKDQALKEYKMCDLPCYNTRIQDRHTELLQLIQIKEEFCPSLMFQIQQANGFRLAEKMKDKELETENADLAIFCDVLEEASEGEYSPAYVDPSQIEETLEPSNEVVIETPVTPSANNEAPEPSNGETETPAVASSVETALPIIPSSVKVTINYNAGWGHTLAICCEPNWDKEPIALANYGNDWSGEVPADKNWKFVILKNGAVSKWEAGKDHNCEAKADTSALNYTGQVKFS